MVIKELKIANPFADNGGMVIGDSFVGRSNEICEIHTRVLGEMYGNLAVVGLPKIGKSSLVWNALIPFREKLLHDKHILAYISISSEDTALDLFKRLALSVLEVIEFEGDLQKLYFKLQDIYKSAKENQKDRYEFKYYVNNFFIQCKRFNCRVTFILDEFDQAETLFTIADFQYLRSLSYEPDKKVCLITISRKTLQELEPENGAISNFYSVFSELHLQLFDEKDLNLYWNRIENLGIEIRDEYRKQVNYFVGNHPYWLNIVNYHILNRVKSENKSGSELLSEIGNGLKKCLWDNYDDIIALMDKEGLKSHFIQAVVGPVINLTQMSIERLAKYGLVKAVSAREKYGAYFQALIDAGLVNENDISYNSISKHFNDYLKQNESEFEIWALWNETEFQLRKLITFHLKEKYGEEWRDAFILANPKKGNDILRMEDIRAKTKRSFGNLASDNIVSYTYPLDMWNCFISTDWTWFQKILTGQLASWRERLLFLSKIRNPIAHSNRDFVNQIDQSKAKEICNELIEKIRTWEEHK